MERQMNKLLWVLLLFSFCTFSAETGGTGDNAQVSPATLITSVNSVHPVVGQKLVMRFEVAVDGYFIGGTKFDLPSLAKVRLLKNSNFAINGSKREGGKTFATQIWEVDLFIEHAGLIEIPRLNFHISYKNANGNSIKQTLVSDPINLFAYLPDALSSIDRYIVSPRVSISQRWIGEKGIGEKENGEKVQYQVGDILKRQIIIEAADIQSIQIPQFVPEPASGIKIVTHEARLNDSNNRGTQTATLTQSFTYIINQPGIYYLGKESIFWWNNEDNLQVATFEVLAADVAGLSPNLIWIIVILGICCAIITVSYVVMRKRPVSLKRQLRQAVNRREWQTMVALLYQISDKGLDKNLGNSAGVGIIKTGPNAPIVSRLLTALYGRRNKGDLAQDVDSFELKKSELKKSELKKIIQ
jgi:hypothetical protein